jgi:uncharacterized Zn finger protein (UPF0148 family)
MTKICPSCSMRLKEGELFCPECKMYGEEEDESKKNRKSTLDKNIYDYLKNEFKQVYAAGYDNVKGLDIFDERGSNTTAEERYTRWNKESSSLVLKDRNAFLSVEMMANVTAANPITVAGNVLIHSIADSILVKFTGRRNSIEYVRDKTYPRYLLIVIPNPKDDHESYRRDQMVIIEQNIKKLNFLENSSIKNFKICLTSEFESALKELITE